MGWFQNLRLMTKLMCGFGAIGLLIAGGGTLSTISVMHVQESLRIVYEDYTVAGTDLAHAATALLRHRNNMLQALNTVDESAFRKTSAEQKTIEEKMSKSIEAYAATVLRVSRAGKNEARDLQVFRDALASYFMAAQTTLDFAGEAITATTREKGDVAREKARQNAAQNAGPKLLTTMNALDELVETVRDVAKDMNEDGKANAQRAFETTAIGTIVAITLGLLIGYLLARALVAALHQIGTVASLAAQGDLTHRVSLSTKDEMGQTATAFNSMMEKLTQMVHLMRTASEQISTAATEVNSGTQDLSQRTSEQASALEETSASMEEMTSTVKQNADNAKQANQLGHAAREVAERGGAVVTKAVASMEEINKSSKKIADIITVIDEIAFQTNLLALNAAVEAARAGEHGRGFAVVAAEVRNLAQRSAGAAKEIKGLINESVQKVGDGSELVNQSGKTLEEIVTSVKRVTDILAEISAASQEQAQGIDQVNKAIMQMDETTQQNAALVEQSAAACQNMHQQTTELMQAVSFFKLETHGTPPPTAGPPLPQARRPMSAGGASRWKTGAASVPQSNGSHSGAAGLERDLAGVGSGLRQAQNDFEEF